MPFDFDFTFVLLTHSLPGTEFNPTKDFVELNLSALEGFEHFEKIASEIQTRRPPTLCPQTARTK